MSCAAEGLSEPEFVLSGPCRTPYSGDITQIADNPFIEEVEFNF